MKNIEWKTTPGLTDYEFATKLMEKRCESIFKGTLSEQIWLLEHPSLYTWGTSAKKEDLISPNSLPVYKTGRGGQFTYHGPGQRIIYIMMDLRKRKQDIRLFIYCLEEWIIQTLEQLNIKSTRIPNHIGIWINNHNQKPRKIAAIGVRVKKWITYHGISININPDLFHYDGIIPCGIKNYGITSIYKEGTSISNKIFDSKLIKCFEPSFKKLS
ncbi:lipoyl(octanoyl) transferase LipB [Alphaproteobacteria bacterium]|nr:lipoyl(octanoyl) transferase LipB [Alphaproteobacteria bacterium]